MKFPNLSDLDREQRLVYNEAPTTGSILITGAPGTGKTIMAFHRAHKLRELGESPQIFMYNHVLTEYTASRSGLAEDIPVTTMHKWVSAWWRGFSGSSKLPGIDFDIEWNGILERALEVLQENGNRVGQLPWGHLLIDEGQDFPKEMYYALGKLARSSKLAGRAQITVFADDNQRLKKSSNCETKEIREFLMIDGDAKRNFNLRKNFRNSLEIARFAAYFQVSEKNGPPDLPERKGGLPLVILSPGDSELMQFITRKVKSSPGRQVGVIVHGRGERVQQIHSLLSHAMKDMRVKPQMYLNTKDGAYRNALDFKTAESVTILHQNSAKGLEFDIVFYVGLETMDLTHTDGLNERMALYVMCSRARADLILVFNDISAAQPLPGSVSLMPSPAEELCRFSGLGNLDGKPIGELLKPVQWSAPLIDSRVVA